MAADAPAAARSGILSATHAVYGAAILSSAFLLFLVQPMVGKRVIPLFGGRPASGRSASPSISRCSSWATATRIS